MRRRYSAAATSGSPSRASIDTSVVPASPVMNVAPVASAISRARASRARARATSSAITASPAVYQAKALCGVVRATCSLQHPHGGARGGGRGRRRTTASAPASPPTTSDHPASSSATAPAWRSHVSAGRQLALEHAPAPRACRARGGGWRAPWRAVTARGAVPAGLPSRRGRPRSRPASRSLPTARRRVTWRRSGSCARTSSAHASTSGRSRNWP